MHQPTVVPAAGNTRPRRVTRYWPDHTEVTPEVEDALDRIVATVKRVQARQQTP